MWCHLPTGFNRRVLLRYVAILMVVIALFTTLIFPRTATAADGINKTLNFQGRLLNSSGGVVPDGYYNIQFKIYEGGSGAAAGNPDGTLAWTETYVNNNAEGGIRVKNGLMSVNLGSLTPFGTSVDWNEDTLWLSMNIAGSDASCSTFGSGPCAADGEMLPMKRLTSTPYAMNAGAVGGKTAENLVQLAQGVQNDTSDGAASININKTGTDGEFVRLQGDSEDVLRIDRDGDIEFGSQPDHSITVATAADSTAGGNLTISSGDGGAGSGGHGGSLILQGGGGGTDSDGGSVSIEGGEGSGTGSAGSIYVGSANNAGVQIGNTNLSGGEQTIVIGTNANSDGISNVVIGATSGSGGGTTKIQSKNNTVIATDGVDRATFDTDGNLTLGNGASSATPDDFTIQGTSSSASGVSGGSLNIQGGGATAGNADGGDLYLGGGSGSGSGSDGLVVISAPTYTNSGLYSTGVDLTIPQNAVDSFGVVNMNAEAADVDFTLPAPSRGAGAAGRVVYVTAADGSENFMLRANIGAGAGELAVPMKQNTTTTVLWSGSLWTVAGGSGAANLQSSYDNSVQAGDATEITLDQSATGGLTIRDAENATDRSVLDIQSANGGSLFTVNNTSNEYASNGGAETAGGSPSTFPVGSWSNAGASTVTRHTTASDTIASGEASVRAVTTGSTQGAYNLLSDTLTPDTEYTISVAVRADSGTIGDMGVAYSRDGSDLQTCAENQSVTAIAWKKITCTFTTPSSGITSTNGIAIGPTGSTPRTFYVDNLSVTEANATAPNVQVGGGNKGGAPTLFTLDSSSDTPIAADNEALLGSMYYDTSLGKVQCYEADGWGSCGASPDSIVTMTPEYANAVMHGTGIGAMTADFCSDDLNINDGSSAQDTICGTDETRNLYKWTSPQSTTQEYGIYVTYKLPETFKSFDAGSTSLQALTDDSDASVTYQVHRSNDSGLVTCGSPVATSTGAQSSWQTGTASGAADPANCSFSAGDSLVIKIVVSSSNNANAYVGDLSFTFDNQ